MTTDDGRNIDIALGALTGEAAGQQPLDTRKDIVLHSQSFPYVPSRQSRESPTYYGHPMLKEPVWIWSIPTYFYAGGVAGVSAALGAAAQLIAPGAMRALVVRSRWIATAGGGVSAALLIHDLGRPERFLNMLRVFRLSSPMSVGSWILAAFSSCAGAAAILPGPLANAFGLLAGFFGLGLSGYTGVLISQSAVPVWQTSYRTTPILFLASGAASAASFLELFKLNRRETAAIKWFGAMGKMLELATILALELEARRIQRVGRPLRKGFSGFLWQSAKAFTVASAIVSIVAGKSRPKRIVAGALGSIAGLFLRFGIFYAGKASARDPRASFEQQRRLPAGP